MSVPTDPAGRHRVIAAGFTRVARSVPYWSAPTPVPAWAARDVVGHLLDWCAGFIEAGTGIVLPAGPDPGTDPAAAWEHRSSVIEEMLAAPDPGWLRHPQVGELPLADALDRFYTTDVFMHTWDLATSAGVDHGLDPEHAAQLLAGMEPMDALLRSSGHYGPAVPVSSEADPVSRLMAFVGRDPAWRRPPD